MSAAAPALDPQTLANRENSLLSTGPVSAAGKARSSMNSLRHGLTSKQIVLPGEEAAEYEALRADTIKFYAPVNSGEEVLVEELAAASWRLLRVRGQETAILAKLMGDKTGHAGFATLFVEKPKEIARLTRYITTIERAYYRALNKLEKMQAERKKVEQAEAVRQAWIESLRERQTADGFVSQSDSKPLSQPRKAAATASGGQAGTALDGRR